MKLMKLLLALIMLLTCVTPARAIAEDTYTMTFVAKLSDPVDIPDGYGLLARGAYSYMTYSFGGYEIGETLTENDVPKPCFLGNCITFEGWDTNPVGYKVTSDMTFTANFNNDNTVPAFFKVMRAETSQHPTESVSALVEPGLGEEGDAMFTYVSMLKTGEQFTEATIPEVCFPTGTMYDHIGWDKEPIGAAVTEPTELVYTVWPTYRVMFVAKLAGITDVQFVRADSGATAPVVPEVDGYLFIGWDKDYSVITSDITIYALQFEYGDATLDGIVNTGDAVAVLGHSVGLVKLSSDACKIADLTDDTNVNTCDAVAILRKCAGI